MILSLEHKGALLRLAAACAAIFLISCEQTPRSLIDGVVVFDGLIPLDRGKTRDTGRREYTVPADGTFVGIVTETDADVQLKLERFGGGAQPLAFSEVESHHGGTGIEVAALDVKRGDRLVLSLQGNHEFTQPARIQVKVLRYDATAMAQPAVRARVQAYHDYAAVIAFGMTADVMRESGLRRFDSGLAHFESIDGDPYLAAWMRLDRANALGSYNIDMKQSLADARKAVEAFRRIGDAHNRARARAAEAGALAEIGRNASAQNPTAEEAMSLCKQILVELEQDKALSRREHARMLDSLGAFAYYEKNLPEAMRLAALAVEEFRAIGDINGARAALGYHAVYAGESGDWQSQLRTLDELLTHLDEIQRPDRRVEVIVRNAYAHMSAGNSDIAVERWLWVLKEARQHGQELHEVFAMEGLSQTYWERGDSVQAEDFNQQARKLRVKFDEPEGLMFNVALAGDMARGAGDQKKAIRLHGEALKMSANNDSRMLNMASLGRDHAAAADHDRAIAIYRDALGLKQSIPIPFRARTLSFYLAESLLARKGRTPRDVEEAFGIAAEGLRGAIADGDIGQEQQARKLLAEARAARGETAEAEREYERAIALILRYRAMSASPEQQANVLTRLQDTYRGYTDLLMRDVVARGASKLLAAGKAEEKSLRVLESVRTISFEAVRVSNVDAATQGRVDQLLARMASKRVALANMLENNATSTPSMDSLRNEIARLRAEIDTELARGSAPKTDELLPQQVSRPWPAIAAEVTQLSYALGRDHAYLWIRDSAGIRATVLAATPSAIEREIDRLASLRRAHEPDDSVAQFARLSAWLLPEGAIAPGTTRLEIVADGKLAGLPFAALASPVDRARRLAETHSIDMITSTLEDANRGAASSKHAMRLVALAGFVGKAPVLTKRGLFPVLGSTGAEARAIAALYSPDGSAPDVKLLTGDEGSAAAVKAAWTRGADVFHFATHGLADLRQPLASLLMLPAVDSAGNATYLTAGQVQSWRGEADLVYLSACETAVGPARFADGMPGLQRAFLRAGARGVIATLWPIEDAYASQFATEFYKRYTAGMSAAQALSETQRAWLEARPGVSAREQAPRRMTAWAHVYYTK